MSKPAIVPDLSVSGIAVDPKTLERVIPESRRPDGSVRKQLKVRPGFTPQEDVSRFRGSRQQQQDRNALPKGHILGWVAPSSDKKGGTAGKAAGSAAAVDTAGLSKSAAKNAKRKAKKQVEKEKVIQANWEDSDEEKAVKANGAETQGLAEKVSDLPESRANTTDGKSKDQSKAVDELAEELEGKLDVR
ncbi:hypothetical protein DFH11DRAFT_1723356 [Phellopilus nigrolimitatus]|nr:hypothetical protein DFH11DRAFT_1723356 [Phellopilus nigrolimitatus]